MLFVRALVVETFATHIACETVLSCMNRMVIISILSLRESFWTIFTLIFYAFVFIHMNLIGSQARVSLPALFAVVLELSRVQLHVVVQ